MSRVIFDVNHKYFHRAFHEISYLTDDIEERHQEHYLYIANMGLGFFSPANAFWLSYVALSIILQEKDTTFFNMMIAN